MKKNALASYSISLKVALLVGIVALTVTLYYMIKRVKETYVNSVDPNALPYSTVVGQEQYEEPLPSLDFVKCSKDCCSIENMSSMSCMRGCVCKNDKNNDLLTTRGGNRTYSVDGF